MSKKLLIVALVLFAGLAHAQSLAPFVLQTTTGVTHHVPVFDVDTVYVPAGAANSYSYSHRFGSITNGVIAVAVELNGPSSGVTNDTLTVGGVVATRAVFFGTGTSGVTIGVYVLAMGTVAAGNQTVKFVYTGTAIRGVLGSSSWSSANQTTPYANWQTQESGSGTSASLTITSTTNDMVIDAVYGWYGNGLATKGASQTQMWSTYDGSGNYVAGGSYLTGSAGSTGMSWTDSPAGAFAYAAGLIQGF